MNGKCNSSNANYEHYELCYLTYTIS